jgi:hypothetical protein
VASGVGAHQGDNVHVAFLSAGMLVPVYIAKLGPWEHRGDDVHVAEEVGVVRKLLLRRQRGPRLGSPKQFGRF